MSPKGKEAKMINIPKALRVALMILMFTVSIAPSKIKAESSACMVGSSCLAITNIVKHKDSLEVVWMSGIPFDKILLEVIGPRTRLFPTNSSVLHIEIQYKDLLGGTAFQISEGSHNYFIPIEPPILDPNFLLPAGIIETGNFTYIIRMEGGTGGTFGWNYTGWNTRTITLY